MIVREHKRDHSEFSRDPIWFCSSRRPTGRSEDRACVLEQIRGWGKKVVAVISKILILEATGKSTR
jgi:hypothetical protein